MARYLGAKNIDAVELNPQLVSLVRDTHAGFAGRLFSADNVRVVTGGRG